VVLAGRSGGSPAHRGRVAGPASLSARFLSRGVQRLLHALDNAGLARAQAGCGFGLRVAKSG